MELSVGILPYARGLIVYHVYERTPDRVPTFDEVRRPLAARYRLERMNQSEQLARQEFEKNPERFATGNVLHYTRINFEPPEIIDVPLTRAEIERYHRDNIDKYALPEQIRARHILISPDRDTPEADAAAHAEAQQVLSRLRAGESFETLARRYSDDPPTRDRGGDLGFFARGAMLEPFERVAFAMKPGDVSEPVKTAVGYHIIQLMEHQPMVAEPLVTLYSNVGADAAGEKAQRIAKQRADSVYRLVRTPAAALAMARKLKLHVAGYTHVMGNTGYSEHLRPVMARMEKLPMGTLYPGTISLKSQGSAILWPDSISPPHAPSWEEARPRALEAYVRDAGLRTIQAKRAEIDSLVAAGWSIDSVAALWGGWNRVEPLQPGAKVRGLGESTVTVDSLVFGGRRAPALAPGDVSGWLDLTAGLARVRLVERRGPSPSQLQARMESERRLGLERNMFLYYEDLKKRHAVRIVDARLRDVTIPPPPPENAPF
jgi:peptidyl-prolyl cis-trans isomerase D